MSLANIRNDQKNILSFTHASTGKPLFFSSWTFSLTKLKKCSKEWECWLVGVRFTLITFFFSFFFKRHENQLQQEIKNRAGSGLPKNKTKNEITQRRKTQTAASEERWEPFLEVCENHAPPKGGLSTTGRAKIFWSRRRLKRKAEEEAGESSTHRMLRGAFRGVEARADLQATMEVEKTTGGLLRLRWTRCRGACLEKEDGGEKIQVQKTKTKHQTHKTLKHGGRWGIGRINTAC